MWCSVIAVALQTELTSLSPSTDVPPAGLTLVDAEPGERSADPLLLSHYVQLPRGPEHLLSGVRVADDWQHWTHGLRLSSGESIISKDGLWVAKHWMRSRGRTDAEEGIIARQAQLNAVSEAFEVASRALEETDSRIEELRAKRTETERTIDAEQEALQGVQQTSSRLDTQRRAPHCRARATAES